MLNIMLSSFLLSKVCFIFSKPDQTFNNELNFTMIKQSRQNCIPSSENNDWELFMKQSHKSMYSMWQNSTKTMPVASAEQKSDHTLLIQETISWDLMTANSPKHLNFYKATTRIILMHNTSIPTVTRSNLTILNTALVVTCILSMLSMHLSQREVLPSICWCTTSVSSGVGLVSNYHFIVAVAAVLRIIYLI